MYAVDLPGAHDICDLGCGDDALDEVVGVEARGCVFDAEAAVGWVRVDEASVAVAGDDHEANGVVEGCAAGFEGEGWAVVVAGVELRVLPWEE